MGQHMDWLINDPRTVAAMLTVVFGVPSNKELRRRSGKPDGKPRRPARGSAEALAMKITAPSTTDENARVLRDLLSDPDVVDPVIADLIADM